MAGIDFTFNAAKGMVNYYSIIPDVNGGILLILLQLAGLDSDEILKDANTLSSVFGGTTLECTVTNYSRLIASSTSINPDDTADTNEASLTAPTWTSLGPSSQPQGKLLVCYDPDTTAPGLHNTQIVPLTAHNVSFTPNGSNYTVNFPVFFRAS